MADARVEEDVKANEGRIFIETEKVIMSKAFASKEMEDMTDMLANADIILMGPTLDEGIEYVLIVTDIFEPV